jgi:hypothetical protein
VTAVAGLVAALTLTSGLQGVVTRGPTRPVCREGEPCTAPAPRVRLVFLRGLRQFSVTTDARGRYRIALSPGTYLVRLVPAPVVGGGLRPSAAVVPAGRYATRNFSYDTGIR